MKAKKWILLAVGLLGLALVLWVGLNLTVDPFGVFGTGLLRWDSRSMENNPGIAKIDYLKEHGGDYDAYILGSPCSSAYDPELLNGYTGERFYNLFDNGRAPSDYTAMARYLAEHKTVRHLILNLSLADADADAGRGGLTLAAHPDVSGQNRFLFYLKYAFAVPQYSIWKLRDYSSDWPFDGFIVETGCYDRREEDVEKVGDPARYAETSGFSAPETPRELRQIAPCVDAVRELRELCDERGIELTVILSPAYEASYTPESRDAFRLALAGVTDYWDFSDSPISYDSRYFYDETHFRDAVGAMILARIYGDEDVYYPAGFGVYMTAENALSAPAARPDPASYTADVPVLMYHHFAEDELSGEEFRAQLEAITAAGYHAVSMRQLRDYVYRGVPLPDKPFCITIDDGYLSNYEIAYPILREMELPATIFAIGTSFGKDTYKDTGIPIVPHFTYAQAREMMASGLILVQPHTYDMHQSPEYEEPPVRQTMALLPGESFADYLAAVREDAAHCRELFSTELDTPYFALAYPGGVYTSLSEVALREEGVEITFSTTTDSRNVLVMGLPQSLNALCRFDVTDQSSTAEILAYLGQ